MEELVRERRKELRKEHSAAKSGVAVRDDEFVRTRDDWIEIHEVHEAEMDRKKRNLSRREMKQKMISDIAITWHIVWVTRPKKGAQGRRSRDKQ